MSQTKKNWNEVSPQSENQWKPQMTEENGFKMSENKKDNFREGYYLGSREMKGKDGMFTIHTLHEVGEDGKLAKKTDFTGNKVLNELLDQIPLGTYTGVQYLGRRHKQGNEGKAFSQTNSYHIWKTFRADDQPAYNTLSGAQTTNKPAAQTSATSSTPAANNNSGGGAGSGFPEDNDDLPF